MKTSSLIIIGIICLMAVSLPKSDSASNYFSDQEYKIFPVIEGIHQYDVPYTISGAKIDNMELDCDGAEIIISLESADDGTLVIDIPRQMLDSRLNNSDAEFIVLSDGKEITFYERYSDAESRTLEIPFSRDSQVLEIIITQLISQDPKSQVTCGGLGDKKSPYYSLLSPLKQSKAGIRWQDIQCNDGLELVLKTTNGNPACVRSQSVAKLIERGWATTNQTHELVNPQTHSITKNERTFQIQYSLEGAKLSEMVYDDRSNSIHVLLDESVGGKLVISIPRDLIDAKLGGSGKDDVFFVLIDGREYAYGEISNENERTLTILFPRDAHDIEIIGTFLI